MAKPLFEGDEGDRQAVASAIEDSAVAEELLQNRLVHRFFKRKVDGIFNDFCRLDLSCKLSDYRALHMRIIALNDLRLMLEDMRQKGAHEEDRQKRLTDNDF